MPPKRSKVLATTLRRDFIAGDVSGGAKRIGPTHRCELLRIAGDDREARASLPRKRARTPRRFPRKLL